MTATLQLGTAVVRFDVSSEIVDEVESAFDHLSPIRVDVATPVIYAAADDNSGVRRIVRIDDRSSEGADIGTTARELIDDLHLTIALHSTHGVFIHAGVVGWHGAAIVLPGRSMAGKSTLVAALLRAGATYLSDEYAVVLDDGSVAPYQRPIQLRTDQGRVLIDASLIGSVEVRPLPAGIVLMTRFVPGGRFEPTAMSRSAAALALFDNTVVARRRPERALAAAACLGRSSAAYDSDRPDAEEVVDAVLELASGSL